ncbi:MAG: hypothetical protein AAF290_09170 [Pseudomonadota bacterium]
MSRFAAILLTSLTLLCANAAALSVDRSADVRVAVSSPATPLAADRVSLSEAVKQVRKRYGGRILSAETRGSGASRVHVIKVLTEKGRVQTVRIKAN